MLAWGASPPLTTLSMRTVARHDTSAPLSAQSLAATVPTTISGAVSRVSWMDQPLREEVEELVWARATPTPNTNTSVTVEDFMVLRPTGQYPPYTAPSGRLLRFAYDCPPEIRAGRCVRRTHPQRFGPAARPR